MEEFAYFMIRISRSAVEPPGPTVVGVIERLVTGEKRSFVGTDELLRLIRDPWAAPPANMPRPATSGNTSKARAPPVRENPSGG